MPLIGNQNDMFFFLNEKKKHPKNYKVNSSTDIVHSKQNIGVEGPYGYLFHTQNLESFVTENLTDNKND